MYDADQDLSEALRAVFAADSRFAHLRRGLTDSRAITDEDGEHLITVARSAARHFGADVTVNYMHGTFAADLQRCAAEEGIPSAEMAPTMVALAESMATLRALLKLGEACA